MLNMTNNQPFVFQMDQIYGRAIPNGRNQFETLQSHARKTITKCGPQTFCLWVYNCL